MSFYECMKAYPEGSASASRLALTAKQLGYEGLIICNAEPSKVFRLKDTEHIKGIKVILGAEVTATNPRALKGSISALRSRYPFLMVYGATEELVRSACEDPNVDMLLCHHDARRSMSIATARAAMKNQVAIGFDLSPLMLLRGSSRARWLEAAQRNLQMARKFDLSTIITMHARSHLDLKAPRDLLALAEVVGFEPDEAQAALMRPGRLIELNRRKWLGPGVELL
ncbi:MAG: RNase P subunit p30 family protein [Methanothrix sp.]|nr:RNase P subunit p30 family protein [Methanothrix sp.]